MHLQNPRPLNEVYSIFDHALLGKGSTGNVYLGCANGNPNHKVAIKSINLHQINNEVTRYLLSCEIAALSNLGKLQNTQHENIVRLLEIIILDNFIYLVMQLLQGGTLADYIKQYPDGLPEQEVLSILRQILQGYKRVRDKHIVHRDLKPDNILFRVTPSHHKKIAIIDFGYCQMKEVPNKPQMFYNVGSPKYMSPQAYKENKYSQKSDIWAIGVMLYEMLLGKTCDNGMNIHDYLAMLETTGIPLPDRLKNIHKHLLTCMLAYNHESRITCDEALRILNQYQTLNEKPVSAHNVLSSNFGQNLRASLDTNPSERPNRNNPIFYSALLPTREVASINNSQNHIPFQNINLPRNQSGSSQLNHNIKGIRGIVHQPAPFQPFSPQQVPFIKSQNLISQSFRQSVNNQRIVMNQIVNQEIKVHLPSQFKAPVFNTPKQQLTFSKIITEPTPHKVHVLEFSNNDPRVNTSEFEVGRVREVQNFIQPNQLRKQVSQDVRFVARHTFQQQRQNNLRTRQSQEVTRSFFPQNKVQIQSVYQPLVNKDLTLTRHPYPDLTQSLLPRQQDLTMTRVPQCQKINQNGNPLTDLTQTRIPIQLPSNDITMSRAPRGSQGLSIIPNQRQTPQNLHKNIEFFSQRVIMNKIPNRPFQTVRDVINLKPQISGVRNIENKLNYMRLNPSPQTSYQQQPHSMMLRPSVVQ